MREKNLAGLFLEIFVVAAILAALSSVALPRVWQMVGHESDADTLGPVGCVADMNPVQPAGKPTFLPSACYRELLNYALYLTPIDAIAQVLPLLSGVEGLYRQDF